MRSSAAGFASAVDCVSGLVIALQTVLHAAAASVLSACAIFVMMSGIWLDSTLLPVAWAVLFP